MDALAEADKLVPLSTLTPPGVSNHRKWILNNIYRRERSGLMHAKQGQDYLLPHDDQGRAELTASLGKLWDYATEMVEEHLRIRRLTTNLNPQVLEQISRDVLPKLVMIVSDDDSTPLDPDNGHNPIARDSAVVELRSAGSPVVDSNDRGLWILRASVGASHLSHLGSIRRFGTKNTELDSWDAISELTGPLTLGGSVARLEMDHGFRHANPTGAPKRFSS